MKTPLLFPVLCCLLAWSTIRSQDVNLQVLVPTAPTPTTLAEVISFESEVLVLLTNLSTQTREVKLVADLTNTTTGARVRMRRNIPAVVPIVLAGGEVREFRFSELRSLYGDVGPDDFVLEGIDYEAVVRNESLPEGLYSLCVEALDFVTNELLSFTGNCAFFPVIVYDPPIVIYPSQNDLLLPTQPQNIIFTWTPTGLPTSTLYRLQLVNADDYQFVNPYDVFNYENQVFTYQQNDLLTTFFQYDLMQPPLQEGATYVVRVQAYDPLNELTYRNDGWSEPVSFTYQNNTIATPSDLDLSTPTPNVNLSPGDCVTYTETINTTFNTSVIPGQTVQVGEFTLQLTDVSLENGSYNGSGTIYIDFLAQDVAVAFEGALINTYNRLYGEESLVYAISQNTAITPEA
ncbi:MAG: hypothetical protein AAGJ82_10750, partial [Bacteroidota bacterium]